MQYFFEWDQNKAKENVKKHKISFEHAAAVLLDPRAVTVCDREHGAPEERWVTIGMDRTGNLLVTVHTFEQSNDEDCKIRIISARMATKKEARQYAEETR